ncbi:hypothetical protein TURU_082913 [Turdus rufiventris]|nr:hypothetical protein TURU_082913 [Turdus rufiventris]
MGDIIPQQHFPDEEDTEERGFETPIEGPGLLFFLLASSPKFRVVSINFTSRPEVCQQPAAPAEPWLRNKEPMDGGGAPAAALRAADRCQTIRQTCRGGLGRETLLSMSAESPGCLGITKETRKKLSWLDSCKGVSSQDGKNPASLRDRGQKDNMSLILFSSCEKERR